MDMGIRGKTALVCAASKGLGKGCAMALAQEGVNLVITARGADVLEQTAETIRKASGVYVIAIAGDITTPARIADVPGGIKFALRCGARVGFLRPKEPVRVILMFLAQQPDPAHGPARGCGPDYA